MDKCLSDTVEILKRVSRLHELDTEHGGRVSILSVEIGRRLNGGQRLSTEKLELLEYAATLHDLGRAGVENHIIAKKGKLTQSQMAAMKEHSRIGYNLVDKTNVPPEISYTVLYHHENWDGSGYPIGLKGLDIPLFARIVRIADCWDAIIAERPYHQARSIDEGLHEMNKCKDWFDPKLYAIFLSIIREQQR